jgi:gliding motility-associated-like protein
LELIPINLKRFAWKISLVLSICLIQSGAFAQICNGSLGDPVVNISFGNGSNPGPPLSAQLPNLTYTNRDCPDDGFYTLANNVQSCFNNTWHSYPQDHTANDVNGYMMLINASITSGDFYVDTVKGLCTGTTYEFAAWVTNVFFRNTFCATSIKPDLLFTIETTSGAVLAQYQTGSIPDAPVPAWKQYGVFFTTPSTSQSVVLRIANKGPGGCGNDLALDDITFRPCGPTVTINSGTSGSSIHQCIDNVQPITINASLGPGYNNPSALWQESEDNGVTWKNIGVGSTSPFQFTYTRSTIGSVRIRVTVAEAGNINIKECRIASNEIALTVHDLPAKGATRNSPVCGNTPIMLDGGTGSTFNWTGPNGFTSNQKSPTFPASIAARGTYNLQALDAYGCKGTANLFVEVSEAPVATTASVVETCENNPVVLTVTGGTTYNWIPTDGLSASNISSPTATLTSSQEYSIIVGNVAGCTDTAYMKVNVLESPQADAGPDKFLFEGQSTTLDGKAVGGNITWHWLPNTSIDNNNAIKPTVTPTEDITYQLVVESGNGCTAASDDVFVRVFKKVLVPNAFSPNADGINDTWRIEALITYPECDISVFDRFGQRIFRSKGYNKEWDGTLQGKPVPVGMYYYVIDVKNGSPVLKGSVLVIR